MNSDIADVHRGLVAQCKAGDQRAFKELYRLYSRAMYNLCYRFIGDEFEAEDVLQESFVNAFKNIDAFEGRSSFGSWLKKIVINRALSHIKKKKQLPEFAEVPEHFAGEEYPDDSNVQLSVLQIREGIEHLAAGYRIVLSMYLLEGYDHAEIAEILEISESTSKTQYSRAKKRLREFLENRYNQ